MFNLNISKKLPIIMILLTLTSSIVSETIALTRSSSDAFKAAENKLTALRESRKSSMENYLNSINQDLSALAQNDYVKQALLDFKDGWDALQFNQTEMLQDLYIDNNPNPTGSKEELDYATDGSLYSQNHKKYHPWFRHFLRLKDYYDIFLFDTEGNLIYTVFKELDYATNLNNGKYKDTDLGNAFRAAMENPSIDKQSFFDFKPYSPSHGAAASFISQAIMDDGKVLGVLVYQMPIARINNVMQVAAGMGESGETYLVGEDYLMRSDSRFSKESTILKTKVDGETVKMALDGKEGVQVVDDYRGIAVLSSYGYLDFHGSRFAILAEIDESEVLAPINETRNITTLISAFVILILAFISIFLARGISTPLKRMSNVMKKIAGGDNNVEVTGKNRHDEIGEMANTVQIFKDNAIEKDKLEKEQKLAETRAEEEKKQAMADLAQKFEERVQGMIQSVASAATQLNQTAESMGNNVNDVDSKSQSAAQSSHKTSQNVATVASATEEMSASVQEISSQVSKSTEVVNEAVVKTEDAEASARSLEKASNEIGDVIKLISEIAEQINLLALNATIESARAGEAGKGFAVVASEVKNLSNQTSKATEDITAQVQSVQSVASEVFSALGSIKTAVDKVNEYAGGISAAVEEQSATTSEIAKNMTLASSGTKVVDENISAISQISSNAKDSSGQMIDASNMLSQEAEKLRSEVNSFINEIKNG